MIHSELQCDPGGMSVTLPAATDGDQAVIKNKDQYAPLVIYPQPGKAIDARHADEPFWLAPKAELILTAYAKGNWRTISFRYLDQ